MVSPAFLVPEYLQAPVAVSDGEVPCLRQTALDQSLVSISVVKVKVLFVASEGLVEGIVLVLQANSLMVRLFDHTPLSLLNHRRAVRVNLYFVQLNCLSQPFMTRHSLMHVASAVPGLIRTWVVLCSELELVSLNVVHDFLPLQLVVDGEIDGN